MTGASMIIGFGASSMRGVGDSQGGWFARAEQLASAGGGAPKRWINMGVGGDTTRDMLARADAVAGMGEHDLVVMLGCNDVPRDHDSRFANRTSITEYEQNLHRLWAKLAGRWSLVITAFPVDTSRLGIDPVKFESYVDVTIATAQHAGMNVWDMHRQLKNGSDVSAAELATFWAPDGLHFNDAGHAWIAERFVRDWLARP